MFVAKEVVRSSWLRAPRGGPMFVANDNRCPRDGTPIDWVAKQEMAR